QIGLAQTQ
nr:Chain C, CPEB3 [Homo sapiens]7N2F_A Chain A, CPEB3 [Homo sapiens]7N2G_A Chain A, CPEB3 [Homo sapiens]